MRHPAFLTWLPERTGHTGVLSHFRLRIVSLLDMLRILPTISRNIAELLQRYSVTLDMEDDLKWLLLGPQTDRDSTIPDDQEIEDTQKWNALESSIDARFGNPLIESWSDEDNEASVDKSDTQNLTTDTEHWSMEQGPGRDTLAEGTDQAKTDRLAMAHQLAQDGAQMPSGYHHSQYDLQATPLGVRLAPSNTAPGQLWPHQLACIGRMIWIIAQHQCALLAYEMGLGKTLIVICKSKLTQRPGCCHPIEPRLSYSCRDGFHSANAAQPYLDRCSQIAPIRLARKPDKIDPSHTPRMCLSSVYLCYHSKFYIHMLTIMH